MGKAEVLGNVQGGCSQVPGMQPLDAALSPCFLLHRSLGPGFLRELELWGRFLFHTPCLFTRTGDGGDSCPCRLGPSRVGSRRLQGFRILPKEANCLRRCPECVERNYSNTHVDCGYMICEQPPSSRHALPSPLSDLRARREHGNKSPCCSPAPNPLSLLLSSLLSSTCLTLSPFPPKKAFPRIRLSITRQFQLRWHMSLGAQALTVCPWLAQGWLTSLRTVKFRQEYLPQRWAD